MTRLRALDRATLLGRIARLNWTLVDQALSSGTNFALALLVVRSVPEADFGAFSVAVLLYVLGIGCCRALTTEPLTIRYSRDTSALQRSASTCLGAAFALGCLVGAGCMIAAPFTSGALPTVLLLVGATFPLLMAQDAVRLALFAIGAPRRAAANDAIWAVLELALVFLVRELSGGVGSYVAAWLCSGALAGIFGLVQLRVFPSVCSLRRWFIEHRSLSVPLFWNYVLMSAPPYLLFACMPLVSGLGGLGAARAAYLPFSPFGLVVQSSWMLLLPAASRRTGRELDRLANWSSFALGTVALVWASGVAFAIPNSLGTRFVGPSWSTTHNARLLFALALVVQACGTGPLIALRAAQRPDALVRVRMLTAPWVLIAGLLAAAQWGATGIALGIAFGDVSATVLSWLIYRNARTRTADDGVGDEPARTAVLCEDTNERPLVRADVDPAGTAATSPVVVRKRSPVTGLQPRYRSVVEPSST